MYRSHRICAWRLYSQRLKNYSAVFFIVGIFPLITGPWLGTGRTVTATGLVLYATGFVLYLYNLLWTYRSADTRPGIALWILAAQFWILAPAGFAPFVLFGIEWISPSWIEQGALHFFFTGWALPIALSGLLLCFRNLPCMIDNRLGIKERADPTDLLPDGAIPDVIPQWFVGVWNLGVLLAGFGFFSQNSASAPYLWGVGYTVLLVLWTYAVLLAVRLRRSARTAVATA